MRQVTGRQPLTILVVTEDRPLQRRLSRFLNAVGYRALEAAGAHAAMAAIEAERPQIVLLGYDLAARSNWALCSLFSEQQPAAVAFKFLLVDQPSDTQVQRALEAGIDDFLHKPVDFGELLTRLRSAARVLEFDHRVLGQSRTDAATGLLSRPAFVEQLRAQFADSPDASPRVACVVLDVDFIRRIEQMAGASAAHTLLEAVAGVLDKLRGESQILGCLGFDRFSVFLPGANETAAVEWAEHARGVLAATKFKLGETSWEITASFGVACSDPSASADELLEHATQALQVAKSSGRNCVVRYGEFDDESYGLAGKLFEQTVASDVMMPCSVFLQPDEPAAVAVDLLLQTRLACIPVVDADGKLLGLCEQDQLVGAAESQVDTSLVEELMTSDVQCFDERESLAALLDFFTLYQRSSAVIISEGRPVGCITRDGLATLSKPLTTGSFATEMEYRDTSEYLLVPDLGRQEPEHAE